MHNICTNPLDYRQGPTTMLDASTYIANQPVYTCNSLLSSQLNPDSRSLRIVIEKVTGGAVGQKMAEL